MEPQSLHKLGELLDVLERSTGEPGQLTSTLRHIAVTAQRFFAADDCVVYAINPITGRFVESLTIAGELIERTALFRQPGPEGVTQRVLQQGVLLVEQLEERPEYHSTFTQVRGIQAFVGLALYGKLFASSSDDQTISLWDVETSSLIKVLHPQSNRIWSLVFFPDSAVMISASESANEDDTLRYWDMRQGQCIRKVRGYCSLIKSVAFSPDGAVLISGSEENELRIWDVVSGRCLKVLRQHTNRLRSVAFSPDGRTAASASEDETVCVWDTLTGLCRHVLRGHTHLVRSVAFSPDGNILASGCYDQTIR